MHEYRKELKEQWDKKKAYPEPENDFFEERQVAGQPEGKEQHG
jgi:hypothetical protein